MAEVLGSVQGIYIAKSELQYFSKKYNEPYALDNLENEEFEIIGEKTPSYLDRPSKGYISLYTSLRFVEYCKKNNIKVIFCLRNPIARLESAVNHHYVKGRIWPFRTLDLDFIFGRKMRHYNLISKGEYDHQIARLVDSNIDFRTFIFEKDISSVEWYNSILEWIGSKECLDKVDHHSNSRRITKFNALVRFILPESSIIRKVFKESPSARKIALSSETKNFLKHYYEPSVSNTSRLLGIDLNKLWFDRD